MALELGPTAEDLSALIRKYDQPGPRYTSYPTAPALNSSVDADAFTRYLDRHRDAVGGLSLYLHVPFCHSLCWYCGCNMKVSRDQARIARHLELLLREVEALHPHLNPWRSVAQLHLGGGTPNSLTPLQLENTVAFLRSLFSFDEDAEISIELDPRTMTRAHAEAIAEAGFNRASLGVQDFHPEAQQAINRVQPFEMVAERVAWLREAGVASVNFDLIYGLPHQTCEGFERTVSQALSLEPNRVALFNFAYVPHVKPQMKLIDPATLPEPRVKLDIMKQAIGQLRQAGYAFIGMDHFAKEDDPLAAAMAADALHRNFQGYTTRPDLEMLGFGMSGISMLDGIYAQNHRDLAEYEAVVARGESPVARGWLLTEDDKLRREIIGSLMCRFELDIDGIENAHDLRFDEYFPGVRDQMEALADDGLLDRKLNGYDVTFLGRMLLRNIAMPFDAYLADQRQRGQKFSRTV